MHELVEMEYVAQVGGQNGSQFQFKLLTTDMKALPSLQGLTSPDELEQMLSGS
jgi:hypothetical protein